VRWLRESFELPSLRALGAPQGVIREKLHRFVRAGHPFLLAPPPPHEERALRGRAAGRFEQAAPRLLPPTLWLRPEAAL